MDGVHARLTLQVFTQPAADLAVFCQVMFKSALLQSDPALVQLHRELGIQLALDHENVLRLLGVFQDATKVSRLWGTQRYNASLPRHGLLSKLLLPQVYLVLQLAEGGDLFKRLTKAGQLGDTEVHRCLASRPRRVSICLMWL